MDAISLLESAVNGMLVGLMYSLVAIGIVLIYKSSSVPNLAQGSMTMLGAYVVLAPKSGIGLTVLANRNYPNTARAEAGLKLIEALEKYTK